MIPVERVIMLVDCQSFYASIEKAAHPEYHDKPVVVAGDPTRRSGIILAACPIAKTHGIKAAETLGQALAKCQELIVIRPRMQTYIDVSMLITKTFEHFTELVESFSIDEQFLDVTASAALFGSPEEIAQQIQTRVRTQTGVWARVGISSTKILAKMACDLFAKKNESGIFTLRKSDLPMTLWPRQISDMFGVAGRMTSHFNRMGIETIGDLASTPLPDLKRKMRFRLGKNSDINAEVYWRTANGVDDSSVTPGTHDFQQSVGHGMTLPRDYSSRDEIDTVLLELSDEVCRRCREKGYMGRVVAAGAQGADFDRPTGFFRQMKLADPTNIAVEVYEAVRLLFNRHWDGLPVRKLAVTLSSLTGDREYQLTMGEREKLRDLDRAVDGIKQRYGVASILRASSLREAGQARERAIKIGGHYK
ncbi:DNA polymerase IV [Paenibacillus plantiphilus]|uniref:DNA polymerase IV n=1 Tax=Paenibacillus plantiphilus TaxID=2905650 RepID=A0ABM9BY60_9BACL|nr:DNA polymerase IV [Paenibacillus plantiphilus]CAH1197663.1 DNA polymerase IV [Paenibacillus plantiphilus]